MNIKRIALVNKASSKLENCINLSVSDNRIEDQNYWFVTLSDNNQDAEIGDTFTPNDAQSPWLGGIFSGDLVSTLVVPTDIKCWQGITLLTQLGLIDQVQAFIDAPDTPVAVKIAFEKGADWHRNSPAIAAIAEQMNWSQDQLDQMFYAASQIQV